MRLGVNIDHVATLRQQRRGSLPDPVDAARICEAAGASGIVCHLREDRRHIQDEDVRRLRAAVTTRLNLEMSIAPDVARAALAIRPNQVTLVPERRQELTTEGGLDVVRLSKRLRPLRRDFQERRIAVSLFIDPVREQLAAAADLGVEIVELHTGRYANATGTRRGRELEALRRTAAEGKRLGLAIAAGHGLDYENIVAVAGIPEVEEVNIGFSIISRAVLVGLEQAVREMIQCLEPRKRHALQTA